MSQISQIARLLAVRRVGHRLGERTILSEVSFEVAAGELVALMGRNGAGKSTLLDLAAGLQRPTAGEIALEGRALARWPADERARTLSHLPQVVRTDVSFTCEQLVLMGRYPYADAWFESAADREAVDEAMARCGCETFRHRRLSTLSGGERQRVLLAACLAQRPRLLLLDEPATFLDIDQQLQCFSLLRDEVRRGAACIAVTHDVNLALTFCSRVILLADGGVSIDLPRAQALERPEWLHALSPRLTLSTTPTGQPWVWYA
jgi:iron complex transport system ATP-binding protein